MSIPVSQLGWMAGILDLKGAIIRKKNKQRNTPQIVLAVETKHLEITQQLGRMTGTAPETQKAQKVSDWMRRGCSAHCPDAHVPGHSHFRPGEVLYMPPISRWTITGAGMAVVFYNVLPFCYNNTKSFAETMEEAIDNTPLTGQGSGMVLKSLRRLDELGWDFPPVYEKVKDKIWE